MTKKVLIISPYFPPSNAADMQRVRMSLPYFEQYGWEAEVVVVSDRYSEMTKDDLLLKSIPHNVKIHSVKALNRRWTSKFGLGSLGLRSIWYFYKKVNKLLKKERFDLIYFSTTQFPVCVLGYFWKKRFNVPYIVDMQDPWHSEYYQDKPKNQRPPKYWFSYRLNKYLEPFAIKNVAGLISVSTDYIDDLQKRYPAIKDVPAATITFGAFTPDLLIAQQHQSAFKPILDSRYINVVYIGRGGDDMSKSVSILFRALKSGLEKNREAFAKLKFYFLGTSYAPNGKAKKTILPVALLFDVQDQVIELTDRLSYYHTLNTLQQAQALFIPGSDDPKYTASKIFPYLMSEKPLLAIFNQESSAVTILKDCAENACVITFGGYTEPDSSRLFTFLSNLTEGAPPALTLKPAYEKYNADHLTGLQTDLFMRAITYAGLQK